VGIVSIKCTSTVHIVGEEQYVTVSKRVLILGICIFISENEFLDPSEEIDIIPIGFKT